MKRSKYRNVRTEYGGRTYDSKFEAKVAADLEVLRRMGVVTSVSPQHPIDLMVHGKHVGVHRVDFLVEYADGTCRFIEAKGFETEVWKLKRAIVEAMYPQIPYEVRSERTRR